MPASENKVANAVVSDEICQQQTQASKLQTSGIADLRLKFCRNFLRLAESGRSKAGGYVFRFLPPKTGNVSRYCPARTITA